MSLRPHTLEGVEGGNSERGTPGMPVVAVDPSGGVVGLIKETLGKEGAHLMTQMKPLLPFTQGNH